MWFLNQIYSWEYQRLLKEEINESVWYNLLIYIGVNEELYNEFYWIINLINTYVFSFI